MNSGTLPPELQPIAEMCDGEVSYRQDGWRKLIFMQGLHFYAGDTEFTMDALLCLNHNNPNYPTKLYLPDKASAGLNWHETAHILGRGWHTFSWKGVPESLQPIEILANHLAALAQIGRKAS